MSQCRNQRDSGSDCLSRLAEGWSSSVNDLCPHCLYLLMEGVDWSTGVEHSWHESYLLRLIPSGGAS